MASNKTRLALVISQEKFEIPKVKNRDGNEQDVKQLDSTLSLLGFSVRKFENLKKQEILSTLTGICVESYTNLECIMVIVLSHGNSGGVLLAKDQEFYTKDVWGPFRDSAKFIEIPKIFIFQACRGINEEKTFHPYSPLEPQTKCASQVVPVLPQKSGFLLVHSTISGHISKRNHDTGTIFIQTLCNEMSVFHKKYGEINFLSLLTEVNNRVTSMANSDSESQTSTYTSFLHQPLILKTLNAVNAENSSTMHVSNDAQGGDIKTSYENKGENLMLILYTTQYEEQYKSLKRVLNHFTINTILVNSTADIHRLSKRNFENVCSCTVIVLAEMFGEEFNKYCETHFVEFSRFMVQLNYLWYQFTASQCNHLRGKPKLFYFFDLHDRHDSPDIDSQQVSQNIESVNNHSDFIWTYCYGKSIFDEIKRALTDPCEEITQLLTTAMRRVDSTACSKSGRSSHFESTLRLQFYYRYPTQEKSSLHLQERVIPDLYETTPIRLFASRRRDGDTDLHIATRKGDVQTMQLILQRDRSLLNIQNEYGSTPLHLACCWGKTEAVKFLLSHSDCSVNICNHDGETVLHVASYWGCVEIMQLILQRDRSLLNMLSKYGYTPLHKACDNGKTEAVKLLLSQTDCLVNVRDNSDSPRTALDLAKKKGHDKIVKLLRQHGAENTPQCTCM